MTKKSLTKPEVLPAKSTNDQEIERVLNEPELGSRDKLRQVGYAIIKDIPGVGNTAAEALKMLAEGEQLDARQISKLQLGWLYQVLPEMMKKLELLEERIGSSEAPNVDEIRATMEAAREAARRCGNAKKRRFIQNALRNAFDEEIYREGLTLSMFESLERLQYPEIVALKEIITNPTFTNNRFSMKLDAHTTLIKNAHYCLSKLESEYMVLNYQPNWFSPTEYGRTFLAFVSAD